MEHADRSFDVIAGTGLSVCLLLALWQKTEVWAARLALPFVLLLIAVSFPTTPNHYYLEFLALVVLSTVGRGSIDEEETALAALRWMAAIVLFQSGLQKVLYGHYFHGDIFASLIGQDDRFATLFGAVVPAGEISRLSAYDPLRTGSGPYRLDSLPVIAASNLTYAIELALPPLMLLTSTRRAAGRGGVRSRHPTGCPGGGLCNRLRRPAAAVSTERTAPPGCARHAAAVLAGDRRGARRSAGCRVGERDQPMRRFVIGSVLAFTAFWPIVHYGLVRCFEISNWKLAGWAMYATPQARVLTALFTKVEGGYALISPESLSANVRYQQQQFERWRLCLGSLWRPDDFGRAVLATRPDLDNVVVLVQRMYRDAKTALVASTRTEYYYPRQPPVD